MTLTPEFSRPLVIESIVPDQPRAETVTATAEECKALAKRFDLRALSDFTCAFTVTRLSESGIVRVKGALSAEVVQTCVVSLRDVPAEVRAEFDTSFNKDGEEFSEGGDFDLEPEDIDDAPVMKAGVLDLGELAAQYLSLELDPYPRAPGVSLAAQMAESGGAGKNRPFQVLGGLKDDDQK